MLHRYRSHPQFKRVAWAICVLAVVVHGIIVVYVRAPHNRDFDLHRLIGAWFLNDQSLYGCGVCYPYMPTAAMYFSLLALVSRNVGFALRYIVAIGCLWLTCVLLHRMVRAKYLELAQDSLFLSVVTVVLAGQFILYDLDDGGPHMILMGMIVGGVYAVWTGWDKLGAIWFGLAIALKVTPGLVLPFFLWKRQWRLAVYTTASMIVWILLPMAWMGPTSWWSHQLTWTRVAAGSVLGIQTEYTQINEDNIRNSGINPALTRYLVTLPPEHPLRKNDPGYVSVLNVPPAQARLLVIIAVIGLVGYFAWATRRSFTGPGDFEWPRECSVLFILMLLLSPLTWIQHLPWLVPALYWTVAKACSDDGLNPLSKVALGTYILIATVLNYELLGKHNYVVFLSFKPFTIGMLLIFAILMVDTRKTGGLSYFSTSPIADVK